MVDESEALLTDLGARRIHLSLPCRPGAAVWVAAFEGAEGAAAVTIRLPGPTSACGHDGTVLEAALRVRADMPFACKGGVCGTCRARLVEGTVQMDVTLRRP